MLSTTRPCRLIAMAGVCAIALAADHPLHAQEQSRQGQQVDASSESNNITVLESGPIHEAFAQPITLNSDGDVMVPKQPPEPVEELPPATRPEGENVVWIPGYWSWLEEDEDFVWVSGVWRSVPPDQQWVPGYWSDEADGYRWTHGFWTSMESQELLYLPAPPESLEAGPSSPAPGGDYFYIPGCWQWNNNQYAWRAGFWSQGYNNWVWVPSRYRYTPRGYVFLNGYWDYPLQRRGFLFAPVRFRQPLYRQAGYYFTPQAALNLGQLTLGLFVAPRRGQYYFGNYYGRRYASAGFYPWFDYHNRRFGYDPLYAYASHQNRGLRDELQQQYDRFADRDTFDGLDSEGRARGETPLDGDRPDSTRPDRDRPDAPQPDPGDAEGERRPSRQRNRERGPRLLQDVSALDEGNTVRLNDEERRAAVEREVTKTREFQRRRAEVEAEGRRNAGVGQDRPDRTQTNRQSVTDGLPDRENQPLRQQPQIDRQAEQRPSGPPHGRFEFPQRRERNAPQLNQSPGADAPPQTRNRPPQIPQRGDSGQARDGGRQSGPLRGDNPAAGRRSQGGAPGAGTPPGNNSASPRGNRGGGSNRGAGAGNRGNR